MTREEVLNILEGIYADVEEGLGYDHEKWVAEVESICEDEDSYQQYIRNLENSKTALPLPEPYKAESEDKE